VTIYGITTKFSIRMHPYPNFQGTKFQGNQIMPLCFIATFIPLQKEEKKEETWPNFEGSYLRNAWRDLVEIWNVKWWRWLAFPALKSFSFIKMSRSYVYMKIAFVLCCHKQWITVAMVIIQHYFGWNCKE